MNCLNKNRVGLAVGAFFGLIHLLWALLILVGWAQPFMDFIFKIHMIKPIIVVDVFNIVYSITLILVTAIIGYIFGYIFALVWNKLHRC